MHVRRILVNKLEEVFMLCAQKPKDQVPSEPYAPRWSVGLLDSVGHRAAGVPRIDFEVIDQRER